MRAMRISAFIAVVSLRFADIAESECNPRNDYQAQYCQQHVLWLRCYLDEYIGFGTDRCTITHHFGRTARFYMNLFLP